jgi:hypothetical protein
VQLRRATLADLDLLVRIDREDEGVTHGAHTWSEREIPAGLSSGDAQMARPVARRRVLGKGSRGTAA